MPDPLALARSGLAAPDYGRVVTYASPVEAFYHDQNGIKQLTLFFGADQGIKTNSEQLISTDQCTFLDTKEAWLCFVL